ncbi:oxidoreductase [Planotetraspora thailandica]|uniref:Oxidoreductase n=1 Tax=Planotetraspora thailandica TaxID=487172 RepID=A0A8J3UWK4_9ACTN|nr:oxidoreductase [Planotetraspora thailandica]
MTIAEHQQPSIDPSALAALDAEVAGPVFTPDDEGYAAESATWNLALQHRPLVVVGATSAADVQAAVRFADRHDLPVAVVATGHGAFVSADGAVLISMRRMTDIRIDTATATAEVAGGVEWQAVIEEAAKDGLAPLPGSSPNVGVVGYTLGGGLSPMLGRRYGFAADHVRSIELVTPDGELRQVDAEREPDLFWALRGGKGNFGVVTRLGFGLVPVTTIYGGGLFFPGEHVAAVLTAFRAVAASAPDELTVSFAFLRLPDLPFVPEPLRNRFTVHVRVAYLGATEVGERLVAPLRAAAPTIIDAVGEMPFTAVASIHADPVDPVPTYERSVLLRDFPQEAADALVEAAGPAVDTPVLMIEIRQLGGALAKDPAVPNAVGNRDARFQLFAATVGAPGMEETFAPALAPVVQALRPWATGGVQVNFLSAYDVAPERVSAAYEPAAYERLAMLKRRYDPKNLFRVNHNIPPQA